MFRGFNITLPNNNEILKEYYIDFEEEYLKYKKAFSKQFNEELLDDLSLNGTAIQENWFTQGSFDVFISHSHKNLDNTISLAGWLYQKFGLVSFIDSLFWGYAANLQKQLDDKYNKSTQDGHTIYRYNESNFAASHVHIMLATALTQMIDATECIFMLNTPDSINASDTINKTSSPWIYHELSLSHFIRYRKPKRESITDSGTKIAKALFEEHKLIINYETDLSHLTQLENGDLMNWARNKRNDVHPLDTLYSLHPVDKTLLEG